MNAAVQVERNGRWACILLSKQPLNVIDIPMMQELNRAIDDLDSSVSVVQLQAGARCTDFSVGVDVSDHSAGRAKLMLTQFHDFFRKLYRARFLTVAAVRGRCLGGGAELACFCDHVVAASTARFGFPEISVGCFPPVASVILGPLVGARRALQWILSGESISASDAAVQGLINQAVEEDRLAQATEAIRDHWLSLSAGVLNIARKATIWPDFDERLKRAEELYLDELLNLPDSQEGIQAFAEKRPPRWQVLQEADAVKNRSRSGAVITERRSRP